jgi:chromate transporter
MIQAPAEPERASDDLTAQASAAPAAAAEHAMPAASEASAASATPAPSVIAPQSERPRPKNLLDLFLSFTFLALQGFGGVLAIVQREIVDNKRWMTNEEFIEDWAVAQIMPGPNVINLSLMIGDRYFGLRGALTAVAGLLAVPLVVVMIMAVTYTRYADNPQVAGALRGMSAVAAGLIAATGLKLSATLRRHVLPFSICLLVAGACFVMIALLRWPLVYPLFGLGALSCYLTWRKLKP